MCDTEPAWQAGYVTGRAEALEEAAKIAEDMDSGEEGGLGQAIAAEIRARIKAR